MAVDTAAAEEVGLEYASLEEADEVLSIVQSVVSSQGKTAGACYQQYQQILTKYQEQPQLLDAYLESIVQPLATLLRNQAMQGPSIDRGMVHDVCRLLHVLVVVRGHKTVVRFFPHEAADLERVLQVLQAERSSGDLKQQPQPSQQQQPDNALATWEAQSVLLLWLSMLVLTPFNLSTVDSAAATTTTSGSEVRYTPLAATLLQLGQSYLHHPGSVRNMAGLLLARLLTRPDMGLALCDFLAWQAQALQTTAPGQLVFLLPGVLNCLALIFKVGSRPRLLPHAATVWQQLEKLSAADGGGASGPDGFAGNSLARKLGQKLAQRIGLLLLPAAQPNWRYQRQAASLDRTLGGDTSTAASAAAAGGGLVAPLDSKLQQLQVGEAAAAGKPLGQALRAGDDVLPLAPDQAVPAAATAYGQQAGAEGAGPAAAPADGREGPEEEFELVEEVEGILGLLLTGMGDKDTGVRWAAAKGLGRLAGCLPLELAEEVVDQVVGVFNPRESDAAWHGGCLALAELARRCLLLPHRLAALTPIITSALQYDVRRGPHSVGAHVRDAAAYVCWGFARAYEPQLLHGCVEQLAGSLLVMACYDREVNCRRAAASAFQECVGRLGNFPHGIEILSVANYYSVGNIHTACLTVAPVVAQYPEYTQQLLDHLLQQKLRHWERSLRALAARGLAALAAAAPARQLLAVQPLKYLLPLVTDDALEVRSGALVGIAELLPALAACGVQQLQGCFGQQVVEVLERLSAGKFYRGKGGDVIREIAARFVQLVAVAVDPQLLAAQQHALAEEQRKQQQLLAQAEDPLPASAQQCAAAPTKRQQQAGSGATQGASSEMAPHKQQTPLSLPLTQAYHQHAVQLIQDCLGQAAASTRGVGTEALAAYAAAHCREAGPRAALLSLLDQCCRDLGSANTASRRGAAAALGAAPLGLLEGQGARVVQLLCAATQPDLKPEERDVESRAAAASSLGQLTCRLLHHARATAAPTGQVPAAAGPGGTAALPAAAVMDLVQGLVLPCLVVAQQDHDTDNRGDVGSWVREAAMQSATQVLLATLATASKEEQGAAIASSSGVEAAAADSSAWQQAEQQQARITEWQQAAVSSCGRGPNSTATAADPANAPPADIPTGIAAAAAAPATDATCETSTAAAGCSNTAAGGVGRVDLTVAVVGCLLEQGLGRIARLREAAVGHLQQLLMDPAAAAVIPHREQLLAALPTEAEDISSISSLVTLDRLAVLLQLPCWSRSTLLGLVGSMGAVDALLSAAAAAALQQQVHGEVAGGEVLRQQVAALLVQLWKQMGCGSRLAVAFLRASLLLLTKAEFTGVLLPAAAAAAATSSTGAAPVRGTTSAHTGTSSSSSGAHFAVEVLQQLKGEVKGCGDVVRLLAAADLAVQLVGVAPASDAALQTVLLLLLNRYPKVRRHAAEQLYLQLLARQADLEEADEADSPAAAATSALVAAGGNEAGSAVHAASADTLEAVLDTLLVTAWDGPVEEARAGRQQLADALGVEIKAKPVAGSGRQQASAEGAASGGYQDNLSYGSLLIDAARGGGY